MRFLLFTCLIGLAGCTLLPRQASPVLRPIEGEVSSFAFVGRLAVHQGEKQYYVNIDWQHDSLRDEVLLTTPLGQGIAEITRSAAGARLLLADRREFVAPDWNTLAEQVFGFPLPLDTSLRWLSGNESVAAGWRINILERQNNLPTVIELERDDVVVRLKIDEWLEMK